MWVLASRNGREALNGEILNGKEEDIANGEISNQNEKEERGHERQNGINPSDLRKAEPTTPVNVKRPLEQRDIGQRGLHSCARALASATSARVFK